MSDDRLSIANRIADGLDGDTDETGFGVIASVAQSFRRSRETATTGAGPEDAASTQPVFLWGPLEVFEEVGVGNFGEVYRAIDPRLNREVALKLRKSSSDGDGSPREFLEEARQLARVRHENVLAIYGADVFAGRVGIWTEYIRGRTLEEELESRSEGFAVDEVSAIGEQIAKAVSAVHESGILHGDVSSRNVILEEGGRVLLADFGCAVDLNSGGSSWIGTPRFAAPELLRGEPPTERSDLYSLATLLFRLATGEFPYEGGSIPDLVSRVASRGPVVWPELDSTPVWSRFKEIVETGLALDPLQRWSTARSFAVALDDLTRQARRAKGIPAWKESSRSRGSVLPQPRSVFVGRQELLDTLRDTLTRRGGLTTLIGPGGSGKTRLALESGRAWQETGGSVWLVDLVPAQSDDDVVPRIKKSLGLNSEADETQFLEEKTRESGGLVLLDNAERVLGGVRSWIATILDACPQTSVLATSREAVSMSGELVLQVPPLELPPPGCSWDRAVQSEAVQLFLDRSRAVGFPLENSPLAMELTPEICLALDGLPLGLEIAASQLAGVPPGSWTEEVQRGLEESEPIDTPSSRHRSLRNVVEWVLPLLSEDAQTVFGASAVFAGGWNAGAAVAVLAKPLRIDSTRVTSALRELWNKSLVRLEPDASGDLRYSMLETVRAVAVDAFAESATTTALRAAHFQYYFQMLLDAPAEDASRHSRSEAWIREEFNLMAALEYSLEHPESLDDGAELAAALTESWSSFADFSVSERFTGSFLRALPDSSPHRPMLNIHRAGIFWKRGQPEVAEKLVLEALDEAGRLRSGTDPAAVHIAQVAEVRTRTVGALLYQSCFRIDDAHEILEPAIGLAESVSDDIGLARALYAMAWTCISGDRSAEASRHFLRSLEIARRCGDLRQEARSLAGLGMVAWVTRNAADGISYNTEAYEVLKSLPRLDPAGEVNILLGLGSAHVLNEDYTTALEVFARAKDAALTHGLSPLYASAVQSEADIHRRTENFEEAARLFRIALDYQIRSGATRLVARCRVGIANSLAMCHRLEEAEQELRMSIEAWFREDTPAESLLTFYVLGVLDREQGNLEDAALWFSASNKLAPPSQEAPREALEQLQPVMDHDEFESAVERGARLEFVRLKERVEARFGLSRSAPSPD